MQKRKWHYKNTDVCSIRKCRFEINWERNIFHKYPNNQVEFLTESILNTFSNFCPNKTVIRRFKDKPWMTNEIKQKLKEKAEVYKKYVKNNFDPGYKQLLDEKIQQTSKLVMDAKERYFSEQGKKLLDPSLGAKNYWSILNNFLQKRIYLSFRHYGKTVFLLVTVPKKLNFLITFFPLSAPPPPLTQVLSYLNFN